MTLDRNMLEMFEWRFEFLKGLTMSSLEERSKEDIIKLISKLRRRNWSVFEDGGDIMLKRHNRPRIHRRIRGMIRDSELCTVCFTPLSALCYSLNRKLIGSRDIAKLAWCLYTTASVVTDINAATFSSTGARSADEDGLRSDVCHALKLIPQAP